MNKHFLVAKLIQWSVPFLNLFRRPEEWPYPFERLADFEDHTLGRELHRFLSSRNLGYLPKYQEHDAYHVLLGYGTTVTEELKLQAFMWGNKNATFAGKILLLLGYLIFPSKRPLLRKERIKGENAKPFANIPTYSMIPEKLTVLRQNLCIGL